MPVRIYFRGLILFRFPTEGDDKGKLVAEMISALPPAPKKETGKAQQGRQTTAEKAKDETAEDLERKDEHETRIQVATGADVVRDFAVRERSNRSRGGAGSPGKRLTSDRRAEKVMAMRPTKLVRRTRVEITVPGYEGSRVRRAPSFWHHVPSIARLADIRDSDLRLAEPDDSYVRSTVVVNGGTVRVNDVVTWDTGFPLDENVNDAPSAPAAIKFMGADFLGHAANGCVVEFPYATRGVTIESDKMEFGEPYVPLTRRNQLAPQRTVEIVIENYEYQRAKPVPWGMDFQLMFRRLGYGPFAPTKLDREEMKRFAAAAKNAGFGKFLKEDMATLLRRGEWWPFPYIASNESLMPFSPLTALKGRPVCVPGT